MSSPSNRPLDPEPAEQRMPPINGVILQLSLRHLVERWRGYAERLERYAPPASEAFRHAAEQLESELRGHPRRVRAYHAFVQDLVDRLGARADRPASPDAP